METKAPTAPTLPAPIADARTITGKLPAAGKVGFYLYLQADGYPVARVEDASQVGAVMEYVYQVMGLERGTARGVHELSTGRYTVGRYDGFPVTVRLLHFGNILGK